MTGEGITKYKVCTCVIIAELGMIFFVVISLRWFCSWSSPNKNVHLHVNKHWHHVRKGFIAFLLDDIACQQAMTSCKKGVYRFLTWWHCLSTFLVDSELILHNKSASQLGMLTLKKEHKSCIAQFYRLWAKLDGHFFSVLHPKKIRFFHIS